MREQLTPTVSPEELAQPEDNSITCYKVQPPISKVSGAKEVLPNGLEKEASLPVRKLAVFVAHGMGQQITFQTIDQISEGLRQEESNLYNIPPEKLPPPIARTVNVDGDRSTRMELRLRLRQSQEAVDSAQEMESSPKVVEVHLYEGYWAPLTEGQVKIRDVITFLFNAAYNGLGLARRPFKRWLFGEYKTFPTPIRTTIYLIVALAVVTSLIVMNLAIVAVAAARAPLNTPPYWLSSELFADLSTTFNFLLAIEFAFAVSLFLSDKAHSMRLANWSRMVIGWVTIGAFYLTLVATIMAGAAIPLLFYGHVIGLKDAKQVELWKKAFSDDLISGFNTTFEKSLLYLLTCAVVLFLLFWIGKFLLAVGREVASGKKGSLLTLLAATGLFILAIVVAAQIYFFVRLQATISIEGSILELRSGVSWPLLIGVSAYVRTLLIQYVGDLAVYITPHQLDRFNDLREKIKKCVFKGVRAVYAERSLDDSRHEYDGVILVGHSLGSVIVYDAINRLMNEDNMAGSTSESGLRVSGRTELFVTFGSPLDKTAFLFALQRNQTSEAREALAAAVQPLIQDYKYRIFPWINLYSYWDIISGKLDYYDPPNGKNPHRVQNQVDPEATTLLKAHIEYWQNRKLFDILHSALTLPKKKAGSKDEETM